MNPAMGSYYMNAGVQGAQTVSLMFGGTTAATRAAYDKAYSDASNKYAALDAMSTAQKNISVVKQNQILSHVQLQKQQDQAEAAIKVSAAVAGAEGASVNSTVHQTQVNQAFASGVVEAKGDAAIDQYLAQVHSSKMQVLSIQDQEFDYFAAGLNGLIGGFNQGTAENKTQNLKNFGTYMENKDFFSGSPAQPQQGLTTQQTINAVGRL
jgi:hypothetical protein